MSLSNSEASLHHLNELWLKGFGEHFNYSFSHIVHWSVANDRDHASSQQITLRNSTNQLQTCTTEHLTKEECQTIVRLLRKIINGDYTE